MQGAEPPDEVVAINADRLAVGETGTDDFKRAGIGSGLAEGGHEHRAIDNEVIRVAGRNTLAIEAKGARHGQFDDVELLACRSAEAAESLQVGGKDLVVFILRIRFDAGDETVVFEKPGHVINVTIGIVADDALAEPEKAGHAEVVAQDALDLLAIQVRVAIRMEKALLTGEKQSLVIHLDGAALEHHIVHKTAELGGLFDAWRDLVIEIVGRIFPPPGVIGPIGQRHLSTGGVLHENRTVIATPRVVGRMIKKLDASHVGTGLGAHFFGAGMKSLCGVDAHTLEAADRGDDAGEGVGHGPELAGPGGVVVRP